MRISHKNKFIFFSNPKTGSESLREMLNPYSDVFDVPYRNVTDESPFYSHITPKEVKEIFLKTDYNFNDYYKVVCVRNPFNRLVSLYEMIFRKWPLKPPYDLWLKSTKTKGEGGGGKNSDRWRMYGTYSLKNYISDDNGKILLDKIICLEHFNEEIPLLFKALNIELPQGFEVIKKNVKFSKKKVADYYSEKSKKLVFQRYQWEIEKFKYEFPE